MTQTEALIASLAVSQPDIAGVYFDDDSTRYIDWGARLDDGGRLWEISDGDATVSLEMSPERIRRLHAALTLRMLLDEQE